MSIELNHIHQQRIACAVESARSVNEVRIRVDGSDDTAYLTWVDRTRHVIASGSERGMRMMLPVVQEEFGQQLQAAMESDRANQSLHLGGSRTAKREPLFSGRA